MSEQQPKETAVARPSARRRAILLSVGVLVGAGLGFAYYAFVGCASGHCPITSNPVISTAYGGLLGGLLLGSR